MSLVHFLNVNDGDCSIIEHNSGRTTVIDVSAAKRPSANRSRNLAEFTAFESRRPAARAASKAAGVSGNFNQSEFPDNLNQYVRIQQISCVFRLISTHPDMDHLDGIKSFFEEFRPVNFWDTDNTKELDDFDSGPYDVADWDYYTSLRDGGQKANLKRLVLYSGASGAYFNRDETGVPGGDRLQVLAPTPELVEAANEARDWNDSSYVILYRTANKRILFAGDSHDATWELILDRHRSAVRAVDVLIAPHHGRDSGRDYEFLDVVSPRLTLFGNAPSEHLAYDQWNRRDLLFVTNNQAGTIVLNAENGILDVFVKNLAFAEAFVESRGYQSYFGAGAEGWFIGRFL